ncbi:MAG: hypothetical protein GY712_02425, partial [Oceanicoccus sp.]|uniref:hypothetical protein n=1 Tax=Oceanicoccus sp. TaxID=2691044 RepID=UPI002622F6AA
GLFAQVGINTDGSSPDTSALLDVKSTDKGMLVPRMTTAQRTAISSPATGLLVFDETTGGIWFYNGSIWEDLSSGDNLGNHTATQTLDLNGNNISAANSISTATLDVSGNLHLPQTTATGSGTGLVMVDGNRFIHSYGSGNFFAGKNAGNLTGSGISSNTGVGESALSGLNEGDENTAIGYFALIANDDGELNTAVGSNALGANTSGSSNTAVGGYALSVNQEGNFITAVGYSALTANDDGEINTAVGSNALGANTSGSGNTAVGGYALSVNQDGNFITAIGNNSGVLAQGLTNSTAIGANAKVNSSNKIQLGDNAVTLVETAGTVNASAFVGDGSGLTGIAGDNLGNHTATQALNLNGNWLSGDGGSEGVFVANSGNVGVGTTSPASSAQFEVSSTSKGFLPPRMTETQRETISSPVAGLQIINSTTNRPNYFNGSNWMHFDNTRADLSIGEFYQEGVVFYLDGSGGGLICAVSDQDGGSGILWYNVDYTTTGATAKAIG